MTQRSTIFFTIVEQIIPNCVKPMACPQLVTAAEHDSISLHTNMPPSHHDIKLPPPVLVRRIRFGLAIKNLVGNQDLEPFRECREIFCKNFVTTA